MRKNKTTIILFGLLFLVYLCLYAYEFEIRTRTEIWIIPIKLGIGLILSILLVSIISKLWVQIISFFSFMAFLIILLPSTGLWKYSIYKYVKKEKSEYANFVDEIDRIESQELTYISCHKNGINSHPKLDSTEIETFRKSICDFIETLDCAEVSVDKPQGKYLFIMSRFIDNGYGLLYCRNEIDIHDIYDERINGFDITNVAKIEKYWYYVTFT